MHLKSNTLLQGGKYKIERFIASGGFGCTYEAQHTLLDLRVALKEFFVSDFCNRDDKTGQVTVGTQSKVELYGKLKKKFMDEARALCKMKHPGIVRVIDVFEENGTAYYAMEYIDGQSLSDVVKKRGKLPEAEAVGYILQVAEALKYVHSLNRLHLDIKPGNIMLDKDGKAVLIDFGASKHYDDETGENTSTLLGINTKGYAPVEQVNQSFKSFSPATDIYALGATLYKLLTGVTPPPSTLLHTEEATLTPLPSSISATTRKAVESAMQLLRKHRPQSVEAWMGMLIDEEPTNVDVVVPEPTPAPKSKPQPAPKPKPARLLGWKWIISGVAAAAIIISVAIWQPWSKQQSISGTINKKDPIVLDVDTIVFKSKTKFLEITADTTNQQIAFKYVSKDGTSKQMNYPNNCKLSEMTITPEIGLKKERASDSSYIIEFSDSFNEEDLSISFEKSDSVYRFVIDKPQNKQTSTSESPKKSGTSVDSGKKPENGKKDKPGQVTYAEIQSPTGNNSVVSTTSEQARQNEVTVKIEKIGKRNFTLHSASGTNTDKDFYTDFAIKNCEKTEGWYTYKSDGSKCSITVNCSEAEKIENKKRYIFIPLITPGGPEAYFKIRVVI